MNIRKSFVCFGLSIIFMLLFVWDVTGRTVERNHSSVDVLITEPELYIDRVLPLTFDRYVSSENTHLVTSTSDLVIRVVDKRESNRAWSLRYHLSMFEQVDGTPLGIDLNYSIPKGTMITNSQQNNFNNFEAKSLDQPLDTGGVLLTVNESNFSIYEYRVKGADVTLELPAEPAVGLYYAIQTVTLENVPTYK